MSLRSSLVLPGDNSLVSFEYQNSIQLLKPFIYEELNGKYPSIVMDAIKDPLDRSTCDFGYLERRLTRLQNKLLIQLTNRCVDPRRMNALYFEGIELNGRIKGKNKYMNELYYLNQRDFC
jgi:hypothetical protein